MSLLTIGYLLLSQVPGYMWPGAIIVGVLVIWQRVTR